MEEADKLKLSEIRDLLLALPASSNVTIVDTVHLPEELFTHKVFMLLILQPYKCSQSTTLPPFTRTNLLPFQ
jgi:hypothetical protein